MPYVYMRVRTLTLLLVFLAHLPLWGLAAWMFWPRPAIAVPLGIEESMEKLRPLHTKLGEPKPGEWRYEQAERGQKYLDYVTSRPVMPRGARRILYIQPIGDFTKKQREIVELSAEFMGLYFDRPAKILDDLPLSEIPKRARRMHPSWGVKQILSTYVLDEVLRPKLPEDAAAYIAFTASDLWPGKGWNFVFGQASLQDRVGVWSIHRNGDPDKEFALVLLRTLKTATHETGHIFSIHHCVYYLCNMCGSNSRAESDRHPLWFCPEDLGKVWAATDADPVGRFKKLQAFCDKHSLKKEAEFYGRSIQALEAEE